MLRAVFFCCMLSLLASVARAGSFEGMQAYRRGDFAAAQREFSSLVDSDPLGAYFRALMLFRGEGGVRDEASGRAMLIRAAEEGYSPAQYLLGIRFLYGIGESKNRTSAISYLLAAAADGDYRAVSLLKLLERKSRGEKKDRADVLADVRRQARAGNAEACYTLAFMYLIGDGVPRDRKLEVYWYRQAASRSPRAAFVLSLMYRAGEGVGKNHEEAARLMITAATLGDPRAGYYAGTFYYHGDGVPMERTTAAFWFRTAAERGDSEACFAYGMLLLAGDGVAQDRGAAVEWLGRASKQGNEQARGVLKELLTYRGMPGVAGHTKAPIAAGNVDQDRGTVSFEGKGVILDQGTFGLRFSLPTLYDAYAPKGQGQTPLTLPTLWQRLQGGTFEIIFRTSN